MPTREGIGPLLYKCLWKVTVKKKQTTGEFSHHHVFSFVYVYLSFYQRHTQFMYNIAETATDSKASKSLVVRNSSCRALTNNRKRRGGRAKITTQSVIPDLPIVHYQAPTSKLRSLFYWSTGIYYLSIINCQKSGVLLLDIVNTLHVKATASTMPNFHHPRLNDRLHLQISVCS